VITTDVEFVEPRWREFEPEYAAILAAAAGHGLGRLRHHRLISLVGLLVVQPNAVSCVAGTLKEKELI